MGRVLISADICFCLASSMIALILIILQIIMAKPAGGPGKRDQPAGMDED